MDWHKDILGRQSVSHINVPEDSISDAVTELGLHAVHWEDFLADATTLIHLKDTGRGVIQINLGYLPPEEVMLPFEPYLRALIQFYWQGGLSEDDFWHQLESHLKLIRNADFRHNTCLTYDEAIYRNYKASFAPYGYAVRERLVSFLGYEPQLQHSLIAEMWLRDIVSDDTYRMPDEMTADDIRAISLIKYREVLLTEGQLAADASPLLGEWSTLS